MDDPLLERAARAGDSPELAAREIARFRGDMEALPVLPATYYVGAVEAMPVIERRATWLLADRGALYDLDGDAYFTRSADPVVRRGFRARHRHDGDTGGRERR